MNDSPDVRWHGRRLCRPAPWVALALAVAVAVAWAWRGPGAGGPAVGQAEAPPSFPFVDARAYGVSADAADNVAPLQRALDAAARAGGGQVVLPAGVLRLDAPLPVSVPANTSLLGQGRGATLLRAKVGRSAALLDVDGKANVRLADFSVEVPNVALDRRPRQAGVLRTTFAVQVRGTSADVLVERVTIDGADRGVQVAGAEGSAPGTCRRLTFRNVTCDGSPTTFGFNLEDCDTVLLDDCHGRGNWLDAVKLRKKTLNVTVRGGAFTGNGTSGTGDGIDAYAGGDTFSVDGAVLDGNAGNGITVKTGPLNQTAGDAYGQIRNVRLVNLCCRNNRGAGVYLTLADPLDATQRLVNSAVIDGGVFEGNEYGLYVSSRNTTIDHPLVKGSRKHGIVISSRAFDVEANGAVCIANGTETPGVFSGLVIAGARHVVVNGGMFVGKDAEPVATDADLGRLPAVTKHGVLVAEPSDDVRISRVVGRHLAGEAVRNDSKRGMVLVEDGGAVAKLPGAAASLRGRIVTVRGAPGEADSLFQCVKRADDTYAWKSLLRD